MEVKNIFTELKSDQLVCNQAGRILSLRAASHVRKRQLLGDITILNTQNKMTKIITAILTINTGRLKAQLIMPNWKILHNFLIK